MRDLLNNCSITSCKIRIGSTTVALSDRSSGSNCHKLRTTCIKLFTLVPQAIRVILIFIPVFCSQYAMFLTLIFLVVLVAAILGFVFRHEVRAVTSIICCFNGVKMELPVVFPQEVCSMFPFCFHWKLELAKQQRFLKNPSSKGYFVQIRSPFFKHSFLRNSIHLSRVQLDWDGM